MKILALIILQISIFQEAVMTMSHDQLQTNFEEIITGSQWVHPSDLQQEENFVANETGNSAKSVQGLANAGARLIFGMGTTVQDTNVTSNTNLANNIATSYQNKAISASQIVFDNIQSSTGNHETYSINNEASVVGPDSGIDSAAVSGAQFLVRSIDGSSVYVNETAKHNTASNNYNGQAVGGVDQAFGQVSDTYIALQNNADDNMAVAGDGTAISGIQTGARHVVDSTIVNNGSSRANNANAENGNAIAGIKNNLGVLQSTFPGGRTTVHLGSDSSNNLATAIDGEAVAGVSTNVEYMNRSVLVQDAVTYDNKAVTVGEGDVSKHAIAGNNIVINDAVQSTVALNLSSSGNLAFNYHYDPSNSSDAIAGSRVVIGSADRSFVAMLANSSNNFADARYGDAIAGNKVQMLNSTPSTVVAFDLESTNNQAKSQNGDAVVYNDVYIGGGASIVSHNGTIYG